MSGRSRRRYSMHVFYCTSETTIRGKPTFEASGYHALVVVRLEKVPNILLKYWRTCNILRIPVFQRDFNNTRCNKLSWRCSETTPREDGEQYGDLVHAHSVIQSIYCNKVYYFVLYYAFSRPLGKYPRVSPNVLPTRPRIAPLIRCVCVLLREIT